jgi:ubiquinone/menaquinone biosynthesis C-methylase UbiE
MVYTSHDMIEMQKHILSFIDLKPNQKVLDIGCGKGVDLIKLGTDYPDGSIQFFGIDMSEPAIKYCTDVLKKDPRFSFICQDIENGLPFPPDSFDAIISNNFLECVVDMPKFLKELHRVIKPQGTVLFAHCDWDSVLIDGTDKDLIREIVHKFGDKKQKWMASCDSWMGRRLWRTFQSSKLFNGKIFPYVVVNTRFEEGSYGFDQIKNSFSALVDWGLIEKDRFDKFYQEIEELAVKDQFFYSITKFIYVGKPIK